MENGKQVIFLSQWSANGAENCHGESDFCKSMSGIARGHVVWNGLAEAWR